MVKVVIMTIILVFVDIIRVMDKIVIHHQVFQAVFRAKGLAGIFEILDIMTMPHHPHRVHFAETDFKGFGYR